MINTLSSSSSANEILINTLNYKFFVIVQSIILTMKNNESLTDFVENRIKEFTTHPFFLKVQLFVGKMGFN